MRVGIIIPDRGDRPEMLKNCLRMIKRQTLQPEIIELVNDPPENHLYDITKRYRIGYDRLRNKGLDVIAFMENDDWYSPDYLQTMVNYWEKSNKPDLLGLDHTIYYHIRIRAYFTMDHDSRSSAMNTLIKPDMDFPWCVDHEPYTDLYLWLKSKLKGVIVTPEKEICMGIKHGVGMTGGKSHRDRLHQFKFKDKDLSFLQRITESDPDGFNFLSSYFEREEVR
jgi:hypothetical protein